MQNRNNREYKELIEKVYEKKFDNKNYIKSKRLDIYTFIAL